MFAEKNVSMCLLFRQWNAEIQMSEIRRMWKVERMLVTISDVRILGRTVQLNLFEHPKSDLLALS